MELSKGEQRRRAILDMLKVSGKITIADLLATFDCSEATARRDLDLLEKSGQLIRTIGGAVAESILTPPGQELPFAEKRKEHLREKEDIAAVAASMVEEGDVIALTGGTTTFFIAKALKDAQHITVVTNAVNIAMELSDADGVQVVVSGGVMRSKSFELCGPLAEKIVECININKMFMGLDGVSLQHGFSTYSEQEAHIAQLLMRRSGSVYAVFDRSKLGKTSLFTIAPLGAVHGAIVDREPDDWFKEACAAHQIPIYTPPRPAL
jgi:DeoR/GlpR family transcriptional regulator of sugar metabolism